MLDKSELEDLLVKLRLGTISVESAVLREPISAETLLERSFI